MKKVLCFLVLAALLFSCAACAQQKNEYYIDFKQSEMNSFPELTTRQKEIIEEIISTSVSWFNSIDISKEQPLSFDDDRITDLTNELYSTVETQGIGSWEFVQPAARINFYIVDFLLNVEYDITFEYPSSGNPDEPTFKMPEEDWLRIREAITDAITFYYGN